MDRRKEPRFAIDQPVEVTVLGEPASAPFQAVAVEISGSGMRLESLHPVCYQAAVKVRAGDRLLLGEVIRVEDGEQGHTLTLKLQHSLAMTGDLYRLREAIHRDGVPVPASPKILTV